MAYNKSFISDNGHGKINYLKMKFSVSLVYINGSSILVYFGAKHHLYDLLQSI